MVRIANVSVGVAMLMIPTAAVVAERAARADEVPIVYSRCPRSGKPFELTGSYTKKGVTMTGKVTVRGADLLEPLPETARATGSFIAPCDLVYRDAKGSEQILYSCIAKSTKDSVCAALDAAVSFDGKTVAFAVFRGKPDRISAPGSSKLLDPDADPGTFRGYLPGTTIVTDEAQIVLADVATGALTPLPYPPNTINFGPAWLSSGRIAFSAAGRRDLYATMPMCVNNTGPSVQLYAMDVDGRNVDLISPHSLSAELHPLQMTDGRIAVSSWQQFGMLAYRHGNAFGGCGTLSNFFHVYAENPDGSNANAIYGQHLSDPTSFEYDFFQTHDAAHFFGQTSDKRMWTAEYYRANNNGLGGIVGFPIPAAGQEGASAAEAAVAKTSAYRVPKEVTLASWASDFDAYAAKMPPPAMNLPGYADPILYAGKLGHPSGLPGNRLMVTWGVGACNTAGNLDEMVALAAEVRDNPACDTGIYRTAELPADVVKFVKHPSELVPIVNSPDYHEFLARPVVPYKDIYAMDRPAEIAPSEEKGSDATLEHGTPFGVLGASSILHRETHPAGSVTSEGHGFSGTDTIEYKDGELCGIRILAVHGNRKVESYWKSTSTVGERVAILGEFAVRNFDAAGKPIVDSLGMDDTSFKVRFPADSPYLMQGIDCEGRTLNTDQTWQSLRPGEVKTCNGCHVHSAAATKLPFDTSWAGTGKATTQLLGTGKVPLLTGGSGSSVTRKEIDGYGYMIEFEKDVMPIFQKRCVSCHAGTSAAAGLRLDLARTWVKGGPETDSTYARLAFDFSQSTVPKALQKTSVDHGTALDKPTLSKFVVMMNSRSSLLYWKAKNARTDNRSDADLATDIDFGAAHPTGTTPDELGVLSRWIDTGAGWGPEFEQDKIYPVVHLVAVVDKATVAAVKVGTTDVGSGIDPASFSVCVVPKAGADCGPNLAGKPALAGVVTVPLSAPLSDPDAEVVAKVADLQGNSTEVRRTVRFLLGLKPPIVPEQPDAGAPDGSVGPGGPGDTPGGGDGKGSCACSEAGRGSRGPEQVWLVLGALGLLGLAGWRRRSPYSND